MSAWCGWVMLGLAVLTPPAAWLGPLAFALLLSLAGLLCLPAIRLRGDDAPLLAVLGLLLAWAVASSLWSPRHVEALEDSVALKLALQFGLYGAAWQGAQRAHPLLRRLALKVLAWGLAAFGVVLLVEAFTGAAVYSALRAMIHDPVAFPYARKNLAQGIFVLALLWPVAAAAGARAGAPVWLAAAMAIGTAVTGHIFLADAPVMAVALAVGVGAVVSLWPWAAPRVFGPAAAALIVVTPVLVVAGHRLGIGANLPLSWAERVGYWNHATDLIAQHPLRGWGLDASRMFSPGIQLHPHNGALQVWLELGLPGAFLGALAWALIFRRFASPERSLLTAGGVASVSVYLLFGLISFGLWQEWWLALGALVAVIMALGRDLAPPAAPRTAPSA